MFTSSLLPYSYTLECNYNSGQQCNALQAATLDDGRASPAFAFSPISRRFSIADFEQVSRHRGKAFHGVLITVLLSHIFFATFQVGRALAYSLLDLHQLNPWTRLPNTSFGSVSGVRQNLLHRVTAARSKKMYVCTNIIISKVSDERPANCAWQTYSVLFIIIIFFQVWKQSCHQSWDTH